MGLLLFAFSGFNKCGEGFKIGKVQFSPLYSYEHNFSLSISLFEGKRMHFIFISESYSEKVEVLCVLLCELMYG
jgi:hypothetical protein